MLTIELFLLFIAYYLIAGFIITLIDAWVDPVIWFYSISIVGDPWICIGFILTYIITAPINIFEYLSYWSSRMRNYWNA